MYQKILVLISLPETSFFILTWRYFNSQNVVNLKEKMMKTSKKKKKVMKTFQIAQSIERNLQ